ncbi:phage minor capsid protein [Paenibacillus sp. PL2-23]|uniref:phage minor capsid protein n=1 Tax=Paenibacillus sp. PL2-23 TaxID=2100729 RepID=UPI0030F7E06B
MVTLEQIVALYVRADERLRELVQSLEDSSIGRLRKEMLLRQIEEIIAELTAQAGQQTAALIGDEYRAGAAAAVQQITAVGVAREAIDDTLRPLIHQPAAQSIMDDAFYSILEASDNMSRDAKRRIENAVRTANERSLTEGMSRREATKQAVADINNRGITGIVAKNGAQIPADKYMAGVVHYHQRKAHVTGIEKMVVQNGLDLVYVNFVGITCEFCAKYQGRVYSISGNDPRFPKLELRPPYHSHCVHSISAWIEEYAPVDEVERMITTSNRPFTDNRTEANIRRYNEMQRDKSRKNETRKQWMRYKAVLPNDTPDLRQFASIKTKSGQAYADLQELYRKTNVINKRRILPKNAEAIRSYGKNAIIVRDSMLQNGPEWKNPVLAESHLAKRIKRKQIPTGWTLERYEGKISELVRSPQSQVYRYHLEGFEQDYFVYGDGQKWVAIVGQDGKLETSFPHDAPVNYRNYLTVDKGYTYLGTVKEVEEGAN